MSKLAREGFASKRPGPAEGDYEILDDADDVELIDEIEIFSIPPRVPPLPVRKTSRAS